MTRESVLSGSDKKLLAEIFAQKVLTGCSDIDLVKEAVRRSLMESCGNNDYRITEAGREARS